MPTSDPCCPASPAEAAEQASAPADDHAEDPSMKRRRVMSAVLPALGQEHDAEGDEGAPADEGGSGLPPARRRRTYTPAPGKVMPGAVELP